MTTVLVADDDIDICRLLTVNLELEGYDVVCAYDGPEARELAGEVAPDAIVLDVMMPRQDGIEVLTELKADDATKDIPVLLLTAKRTDAEVWAGWSAGADCYITKPFEMGQLLHYLEVLSTDNPSGEPQAAWVSDRPETELSGVLRSLGRYWGSDL